MEKKVISRKKLEDYSIIFNIETAAGMGMFGKLFYKECILSDSSENIFKQNLNLDLVCDANKIPFDNNRFKLIILCNPFDFGFRYQEQGISLLSEFLRVTTNKGCILIIGNNKKNPWCKLEKIQKVIKYINTNTTIKLEMKIEMTSQRKFNPEKDYNNYKFYQTGGLLETKPDMRIKIYVTK